MEEESNRGCEVVQDTEDENSKPSIEGEEENRDGVTEKTDVPRRVSGDGGNDCAAENSSRGEPKTSESETLAPAQLSQGDFQAHFDESSYHLSEVPVEYSLQSLQSTDELKDHKRAEHKQPSGQLAQVQIQLPDGPSKSGLSSTPVAQSTFSVPTQTPPEQKLQPLEDKNNVCATEHTKLNSPDTKHISAPMLKAPDGYNWRKYGQKQVKSPEGTRSYYRCTFSDCYAKKIESCDRSNHLIETVYRSHHNHDPPQKVPCARENRPSLPIVAVNKSNDTSHPVRGINDQVPSTLSKEPLLRVDLVPQTKQQESSGSDETSELNVKEHAGGPECQERKRRKSTSGVESLSNYGKKPKCIVHATGDVGISGDGYRWRKYGQKMVKNNPHPRNYYRCTSAGCPVRKHIEKAVDNSSAVVITYNGVHDHNAPVPRKRHGGNSALATATYSNSMDDHQNKTGQHKSDTQWSADKEGKLTGDALNVGGEKA